MPEVSTKITVAVDAMGGDYAPEEIVRGAVLAAQKSDVQIALTGPMEVLQGELAKYGFAHDLPIRCVEANEVIGEDESPAVAVRRKNNSSIAVAAKLVKSGEADALVGAGSSGAVAVSAIRFMGMLEGMERPAIGACFGNFAPNVILMDFGANVDCKPYYLLSFAIAGSVYAEKLLNIANPTVGLLSTGVEEGKGNELVREAYPLLKNSDLNFIGSIEGNDILSGRANVVVCDGFVGNVVIKFSETIADYAVEWLKRRLRKYPPLRSMATLLFKRLVPMTKMSYEAEDAGGGILWGVDGVVRVAHGSCRAPQIAHAILSARNAVKADIVGCLKSELAAKSKKEANSLRRYSYVS
ncbi:MAG: phosphate acyltransferase PlsX [Dehalococcoidia bacterium]|nr:phosphate acyltransferase PlsX [Dehalococcoidia bacterium]